MSTILKEILAANEAYAKDFGDKGNLPMPPGRHFAIVTCIDARLDPAKFAGLREGDAHVFRNAGGRVTEDAIRSLVVSYKLLGTREWFVIHHTDCGMEYADSATINSLLAQSLKPAKLDEQGWHDTKDNSGTTDGEFINWLTIDDPIRSVCVDVKRLRSHPLVPGYIKIYGYLFDVKTGILNEVPEATKIGKEI
ncbi:beta-class carbonic anhydrase [Aphanothece sacrum]|uniref:carbonic anhydrase n=1 Tax=Aphanothece sacrum FPU1 TaxID=1920663 RepID=A0A401IHR7_APHSA|nr:carbonic anhydrase [Aphanothece sacrum]GBF80794.1 carbonic anhydrase [Aphanothece sacrum FPU1]GBF83289.1 carbonic anhydrase [Aphanothece sacrum FPU3]